MEYKVYRHKSKHRNPEYLEGFDNVTGNAFWTNDSSEAKLYDSQHIANIAACNANEHGDIYGDPIVVPVEEKS